MYVCMYVCTPYKYIKARFMLFRGIAVQVCTEVYPRKDTKTLPDANS